MSRNCVCFLSFGYQALAILNNFMEFVIVFWQLKFSPWTVLKAFQGKHRMKPWQHLRPGSHVINAITGLDRHKAYNVWCNIPKKQNLHITGMVGVLYRRPHRIESGHKLQETEITIRRPAQVLLTALQQQARGDRRCQTHQSSSLVYPTPPVAVWPLPTVPHKCTEIHILQTTEGHFPCATGHPSSKGWAAKYLAIFPHFSKAFTNGMVQRRFSSFYCGFQDEKLCSIWISHQPDLD